MESQQDHRRDFGKCAPIPFGALPPANLFARDPIFEKMEDIEDDLIFQIHSAHRIRRLEQEMEDIKNPKPSHCRYGENLEGQQ